MDLKKILNTETSSEKVTNEEVETENNEVTKIIEIDHNLRFKKPWKKLEKGMKLNRILQYVENETIEKELSIERKKDLKNLLFRAIDSGNLNKISDVMYNEETCEIETIKILEFNSSSKKYKLKTSTSKNRSVSKSRSNIDRLIKKK